MSVKKTLYIIVGTRPNFIKITQFKKVAAEKGMFDIKIIHTGQHFDDKMSGIFFAQFGLQPDMVIDLKTITPTSQIAEIMMRLEAIFVAGRPDCVMVVGDVNSTLAAALVANKMNLMLVHLESGLRSSDKTMPEEINRILTDQMAAHLFVTEQSGIDNLLQEGRDVSCIHFVGNTMIDTMLAFENEISNCDILEQLEVNGGNFVLVTMHRPATVDNREGFMQLFEILLRIQRNEKLVFPIHPRTRKNIASFGLESELISMPNLVLTEPLDYFAFQKLVRDCKFILTDSGGIQEESTQRGVPCLTLRPNTERPVTVSSGTNSLVPFDTDTVIQHVDSIERNTYKKGIVPPLWDGQATRRVLAVLEEVCH